MHGTIKENVRRLLEGIPREVTLIAATKTRSVEEIREAVDAGISIIGENYVQEAENKITELNRSGVKCFLLGHLQRNKAAKAVAIFDRIDTIDNIRLAKEINRVAGKKNNVYPVLVEINSACEEQKTGILPENAKQILHNLSKLQNIRVEGLMTMGPLLEDPEDTRPYFRLTRRLFEELKTMELPGVEMKRLSMGMSGSWRIAVEEGATEVRIGTSIFGERSR